MAVLLHVVGRKELKILFSETGSNGDSPGRLTSHVAATVLLFWYKI